MRLGLWAVLLLMVVVVGVFMAGLDVFIVNIAFPQIHTDFPGTSLGALSWILNAYTIVFAAFLIVVLRSLRVALGQPDLYAKLLASGLAATLGFQVFIIVGGVLGLFPLTGITLPFFSYGGSSLVANFLLIALVWAIGSERDQRGKTEIPV